MFSQNQKRIISAGIQQILRDTGHPELPKGEIRFSIRVEGAEPWSWAEIKNNGATANEHEHRLLELAAKYLMAKPEEDAGDWCDAYNELHEEVSLQFGSEDHKVWQMALAAPSEKA